MRPFTESLNIFKTNIYTYIETCKNNKEVVLKNHQAFFLNLLPFTKHHGGMAGYNRATKFLKDLHTTIAKENYSQTQELIKYAIQYQDKGDTLSDYIWLSIRASAGFNQRHINFLAHMYAAKDGPRDKWDEPILSFNSKVSQEFAKKLINSAINGNYYRKLIEYIGYNIGLSTQCLTQLITKEFCKEDDYGQKLLIGLNNVLHHQEEIELVEVESEKTKIQP